jgi:putative DNA primase/helicase
MGEIEKQPAQCSWCRSDAVKHEPFDPREAQGRWFDILVGLGIGASFLRNRHGPCPLCGGKDRFRWDNREGNGTWICSGCGAGDGASLAMKFRRLSFTELKDAIRPLVPVAKARPVPAEMDKEANRKAREALWRSGAAIVAGDPVDRYLRSRLGRSVASSELRTAKRDDGEPGAMMVARVTSADGKRVSTLHRTYLTCDGVKVAGDSARKLMPGETQKGGAVRLMPVIRDVVASNCWTLGIAEGIETALAASILFGVPVWAALNAGCMASWLAPEGIGRVRVFGDCDKNYVGQAAAYECARRNVFAGKQVEVMVPDYTFACDWNDVLCAKLADRKAAA